MSQFWNWLQGNKTHIGIVFTSILVALQTEELIPDSWQKWVRILSIVVGTLTANAARSAIAKVEVGQVDLAHIQMRIVDAEVKAEVLEQTVALKKVATKTAAKKRVRVRKKAG